MMIIRLIWEYFSDKPKCTWVFDPFSWSEYLLVLSEDDFPCSPAAPLRLTAEVPSLDENGTLFLALMVQPSPSRTFMAGKWPHRSDRQKPPVIDGVFASFLNMVAGLCQCSTMFHSVPQCSTMFPRYVDETCGVQQACLKLPQSAGSQL